MLVSLRRHRLALKPMFLVHMGWQLATTFGHQPRVIWTVAGVADFLN
jgi:hypothetical protein